MLQIRLSKAPPGDGAPGAKPVPMDTVTVVCPDHLVLADLPVAKGIGAPIAASLVKTVGRRSRRQLGERVHFCVRCDFPIAVYGRLSPCEHAFCLDCARSDSICYLCDERIQKIQTIKLMEGIFICAAPHCLKSFLKRVDFESHIHDTHSELLQTNAEKDDNYNESEAAQSIKQSSATESTLRAPLRPGVSPNSNSQIHDRDDKSRRGLSREQSLPRPIMPPKPPQAFGSEAQPEYRHPHNPFQQQQSFDSPRAPKQEGVSSESPFRDYPPMHAVQPPPSYSMMNPSAPFSYPPFPADGSQPFYGAAAPYDSAPESGSDQGSLFGFGPGSAGNNANFPSNYHHQPWSGVQDGFNTPDSQGKVPYYGGDFGRNPPPPTLIMPNKAMELLDPRDGKGILAPQPMSLPPPPPPPHHMSQPPKHKFYPDMGRDTQGYGWQHDNRDGFGSGQD